MSSLKFYIWRSAWFNHITDISRCPYYWMVLSVNRMCYVNHSIWVFFVFIGFAWLLRDIWYACINIFIHTHSGKIRQVAPTCNYCDIGKNIFDTMQNFYDTSFWSCSDLRIKFCNNSIAYIKIWYWISKGQYQSSAKEKRTFRRKPESGYLLFFSFYNMTFCATDNDIQPCGKVFRQ